MTLRLPHQFWGLLRQFSRTPEVIGEYVKKGGQLYVEGHLQTRAYLDRDKNKRYVTEVIAERVQLLTAGPEGPEGGRGA